MCLGVIALLAYPLAQGLRRCVSAHGRTRPKEFPRSFGYVIREWKKELLIFRRLIPSHIYIFDSVISGRRKSKDSGCCDAFLDFSSMITTTFPSDLPLGVAAAVLTLFLIHKCFDRRRKLPLPPGPRPWPILGNIADMPPKGQREWKHWLGHMDIYGPVSSVTALGQTIIILHDKQAALELMERRATTHSGRPTATFAMEM